VRKGFVDLIGLTVEAFGPKARKALHIATVHRVFNSRHPEYEGRVLPSQHLVDA
jgi:hypothetical protein